MEPPVFSDWLAPLAERCYRAFLDLHAGRSYGGMGAPSGISYAELDAYQRVRRRPFEPPEIDAIRALDAAYLEVVAESQRKP